MFERRPYLLRGYHREGGGMGVGPFTFHPSSHHFGPSCRLCEKLSRTTRLLLKNEACSPVRNLITVYGPHTNTLYDLRYPALAEATLTLLWQHFLRLIVIACIVVRTLNVGFTYELELNAAL